MYLEYLTYISVGFLNFTFTFQLQSNTFHPVAVNSALDRQT